MPSSGTDTGLTLANRSSSFLMATLADSMLGQGSPLAGVVVGPLRITWHFFSSASVSSGMAFMTSTLLSMVSPSICLISTFPAAILSARRNSMTFCADAQM